MAGIGNMPDAGSGVFPISSRDFIPVRAGARPIAGSLVHA
jgi:hypothetical protein